MLLLVVEDEQLWRFVFFLHFVRFLSLHYKPNPNYLADDFSDHKWLLEFILVWTEFGKNRLDK